MTRIVVKERKYLGTKLVLIHEAVLDAACAVTFFAIRTDCRWISLYVMRQSMIVCYVLTPLLLPPFRDSHEGVASCY